MAWLEASTGAGMLFPVYATDLGSSILWVGRACAPPQPTQPTPQFQGFKGGNRYLSQIHETDTNY